MQSLVAIYGASSEGNSEILDIRFPCRYGYTEELAKIGMDYSVDGDLL